MDKKHVIIIGGGAAGLAAAVTALRLGSEVTMCEKGDRVGKKILVTGNGRCNLTNLHILPDGYNRPEFTGGIIGRLGCREVRSFFESMGLWTYADSEGRVYPVSDSAASVLDVLRLECAKFGYDERCRFEAVGVRKRGGGFNVESSDGKTVRGDSVIFAAGGGSGLLSGLGHELAAFEPVLCPLETETGKIKGLDGLRIKCEASLADGGKICARERGELLFRDYGVSGVMVFDLSRYAEKGQTLSIDMLPDMGCEELERRLAGRSEALGWRDRGEFLTGIFHKRIAQAIVRAAGGTDPAELAEAIKNFRIRIKGKRGGSQAQVTRGGARVDGFSAQTLQSKLMPGVYAAGETLDVDGRCGGYNLHWAFASGMTAGYYAAGGEENA